MKHLEGLSVLILLALGMAVAGVVDDNNLGGHGQLLLGIGQAASLANSQARRASTDRRPAPAAASTSRPPTTAMFLLNSSCCTICASAGADQ